MTVVGLLTGGGAALRRASLAALVLAWLTLVASLALPGLPLPPGLPLLESLLPALPWAAALLGLLGGAFATLAHVAPAMPEPMVPDPAVTELRTAMRELRGLLQDERSEMATLREACRSTAHDAMTVGVRLAGMAMDAETRLGNGVAQAEGALLRPDGALARASDAALLFERVLPEFAGLVVRMQEARAQKPWDEAAPSRAAHIVQAAEAALRAVASSALKAGERIDALGDVAEGLRRDATALGSAGREIATTGTDTLASVRAAANHAEAVFARLPDVAAEAAATLVQAADSAANRLAAEAQGIGTALAAFPKAGETLAMTCAEAARTLSASTIQASTTQASTTQAATTQAAAQVIATVREETAALLATLGTTAEGMRAEAAAARTAGQGVTEASAGLIARLSDAAAHIATTAAELRREATENTPVHPPLSELAALATSIDAATERLRADTAALVAAGQGMADAGGEVIARLSDTAGDIALAAMEAERHRADTQTAIATLPRLADGLADMAAGLRLEAGTLVEAARDAAASGGQAVTALAPLPDLVARLDTAADRLCQEAAMLRAAGEGMAGAGSEAGARLSEVAREAAASGGQAVAALAHLPDLVARLDTAADRLCQEAAVLRAAGQGMAGAGSEAGARLSEAAGQIAMAAAEARREVGQAAEASARLPALVASLGTVEAAVGRLDQAGVTLVAAMARVETARQEVADAETDTAPPGGLTAMLRHLGGVTREAEVLLREAETLAETVLAGRAPALPPLLASRAPALLEQVETTIQRLRSVATAVALASDGPADRAAA